MPLKKELSKESLARIQAFYASVCGQMRRNKTGKDFNLVIFLDYKGDPCHSKNRTHTIFLKARPSPHGFSIYNPVVKNDKTVIQHTKLIGEISGTRKAKTIGPSRNYKVTREERPKT